MKISLSETIQPTRVRPAAGPIRISHVLSAVLGIPAIAAAFYFVAQIVLSIP